MQAAAGGGLIAGETYAKNEASAMKSRSKCSWIALFAALGLAMNVGAAEPPTHVSTATSKDITFGPAIAAAEVMLVADAAVTLHRAEKTAVGTGKVFEDVIGPKANFSTDARMIPLVILAVGPRHGAYLGFEWELGGFKVSSQADPLRMTASVQPITENVTRASGGSVPDSKRVLRRLQGRYRRRQQSIQEVVLEP